MANRGLLQAVGSWSVDACCAVHGNDCGTNAGGTAADPFDCSGKGCDYCYDRASSSDWLFGLWPGPPQRFEPIRGVDISGWIAYQVAYPDQWPSWDNGGLDIGETSGAPGWRGACYYQGRTYRGTEGEICGGSGYGNWGATDVEVWYPH